MGAVWDERSKYRHWQEIEILAAEAWAQLGVIPAADAAEIRERAMPVDPDYVAELERTLEHDVIAFLTAMGEPVGEPARWIHYGMTSSDLLDTALALQLREACDLLLGGAGRLVTLLKERAVEFKDAVCVGRTHGIHAEPTTFGLKLAVWAFEVARGRYRLVRAREAVSVGKIAGPVGTYGSVDPFVERYVCERLGLGVEDAATQVIQRDRHAEFLASCGILASTLDKIATEIRHLQRTEVREAEEPFREGQKGSSAMPHKRNPILCERISGLARIVRATSLPAMENLVLWHERDISHSSAERVILPDASIALDYMLHLTNEVIANMRVYPERMKENLDASGGLVYSAAVLLELVNRGLSREDAYAAVQRAAMRTWEAGTPFRRTILEETDALDDGALDKIMDPRNYLTHADVIFKRLEGL
jgi:adenylosuccinate lyase